MHTKTDPVNKCPYYSIENIINGWEDEKCEIPIMDLCEICNKEPGYCIYLGIPTECEVFNGKED